MRKFIFVAMLNIFCSNSAWAGQMYNVDILPAKPHSERYHTQCSIDQSPCMLSIDAGTFPIEKNIRAKITVTKQNVRFDFLYNGKVMRTGKFKKDPVILNVDQPEPAVVDLYEPSDYELSNIYAVIRPTPQLITSLEISLTKAP